MKGEGLQNFASFLLVISLIVIPIGTLNMIGGTQREASIGMAASSWAWRVFLASIIMHALGEIIIQLQLIRQQISKSEK